MRRRCSCLKSLSISNTKILGEFTSKKNLNNNLSSNYDVAKRRFDQLITKFQNDDKYREVIQDYVSHGIVEHAENIVSDNQVHYLPHRGITN